MICKNCNTEFDKKNKTCPSCNTPVQEISIISGIIKADEFIAALSLTVMILVVLVQIILRNFFQTGIGGADPLVRHLVLWVVFLGAGLTAKDNSHIKIDFLSKLPSEKAGKIINSLVSIFSTIVLGIMIYAAASFVKMEYESGLNISLLNIPVWVAELIIPVGYTIIAVHIVIQGVKSFSEGGKK